MGLEFGNEGGPELKDYIYNHERLSELSPTDIEVLIEEAQCMAVEIPTGDGKQKYLQFIQAAQGMLLGEPSASQINVESEYTIEVDGQKESLKTRADRIFAFSDLANVNIRTLAIDHPKSDAYIICITAEKQRYWINLKLFRVTQKDGTSQNVLYIADRYVIPTLRGGGIGEKLLQLADRIANENDCNLIFARLISEEPDDTELLKAGHQKAGYEIQEDRPIAVKNLPQLLQ
ncbi:GNAT family N-acetyltransferase [Patescibacteria group bacterium]